MKLQQMRFLAAVAQNDLNLTAAAARLGTTQPAVSKQLKLLEDELGFDIFVRNGRSLSRITLAGETVVAHALRMLREVQVIKGISDDITDPESGALTIGTTHTQARYVLPEVVRSFRLQHPGVNIHLNQGTSEQIEEMAALDRIDLAIDSGSRTPFEHHVVLPCHRWQLSVVVPREHPLTRVERLSLRDLAAHPLITYEFGLSERAGSLREVFSREGLQPGVALTAWDSDVIKTYVRLRMGVGIVSEIAVEASRDTGLVYLDARHLFPINTTWVAFARGIAMRGFVYDFLSHLGPHLTRERVERAAACTAQAEIDALFEGVDLESWRQTSDAAVTEDTREPEVIQIRQNGSSPLRRLAFTGGRTPLQAVDRALEKDL